MNLIQRSRRWAVAGALAAASILWIVPPVAAAPYDNPGPFFEPLLSSSGMPDLPAPAKVPGKEFAFALDPYATDAVTDSLNPSTHEQVVNWDGYGGTANGLNYDDTRPGYPNGGNLDALANFYDTLVPSLLDDRAHLVFSVAGVAAMDNSSTSGIYALGTVASAGPLVLSGGSTIGGAGELSYEQAGAFGPAGQGLWASQADIDADNPPEDIGGVELWGPEPTSSLLGDANKYSLASDYDSFDTVLPGDAVAVWNADGTPFVAHSMVVDLVTSLLGTPAGLDLEALPALVNVDALMVQNLPGASPNAFDADTPYGPEMILLSISQIPDAADPTGYYATGSELFVMDGTGAGHFLSHGGHVWDKDYAVSAFRSEFVSGGAGVVDINALEAVAVPEPAAALLLCVGACAAFGLQSRRPRRRCL